MIASVCRLVPFAGSVQLFKQMLGPLAFVLGTFPFLLGTFFRVVGFGLGDLSLDSGLLDFCFRGVRTLPFSLRAFALFLKSAVFEKSNYHDNCS